MWFSKYNKDIFEAAIKQTIKTPAKIIILGAGLLFLLLHFGLILLQNSRPGSQHKLFYLVRAYETFFHQSWNVFVPPPNTNYKLFVEFENHGLQKKEVFGDILLQHQQNRFKGYEPLVITLSNCMHTFEKSTALQSALNGPVKNDINFTMIEQAVKSYLNHAYKIGAGQPRLILVAEDAKTKKQRVYFN